MIYIYSNIYSLTMLNQHSHHIHITFIWGHPHLAASPQEGRHLMVLGQPPALRPAVGGHGSLAAALQGALPEPGAAATA